MPMIAAAASNPLNGDWCELHKMVVETEADYSLSRAEQCRLASLATTDPASEFAHRKSARGYEQWSLAFAAKAHDLGGAGE